MERLTQKNKGWEDYFPKPNIVTLSRLYGRSCQVYLAEAQQQQDQWAIPPKTTKRKIQ